MGVAVWHHCHQHKYKKFTAQSVPFCQCHSALTTLTWRSIWVTRLHCSSPSNNFGLRSTHRRTVLSANIDFKRKWQLTELIDHLLEQRSSITATVPLLPRTTITTLLQPVTLLRGEIHFVKQVSSNFWLKCGTASAHGRTYVATKCKRAKGDWELPGNRVAGRHPPVQVHIVSSPLGCTMLWDRLRAAFSNLNLPFDAAMMSLTEYY